ncbi:MAG: hypothetical protein ACJ793_04745 [Gemmatimonadaceae bacterium]
MSCWLPWGADADSIGQALRIDAADQLDSDKNVPIGSSRHHWRGKVVALNDPERVPAPTKSGPHMRLRAEAHLIGVNPNEQQDIGGPRSRTSKTKGCRIGSGACGSIARAVRGIRNTDTDACANTRVIREQRCASGTVGGSRDVLRCRES